MQTTGGAGEEKETRDTFSPLTRPSLFTAHFEVPANLPSSRLLAYYLHSNQIKSYVDSGVPCGSLLCTGGSAFAPFTLCEE